MSGNKQPAAVTHGDWTGAVIANGGGWLPPDGSGEFSAELMATCIGVVPETMRRYVKLHGIPVRIIGGMMFMTPEAIRGVIPCEPYRKRRVTRRAK